VDIVYVDFSEAFGTVSHKILTEKLVKHGLEEQAVRVTISGAKCSWRPVTNGVLQVSVQGLISFNIFINDLGDEAERTDSKFPGDTKLGGAADTPEYHAAI